MTANFASQSRSFIFIAMLFVSLVHARVEAVTSDQAERIIEQHAAALVRVEISATTTWQQNDQERSRSYQANWPGVIVDPSGIVVVPEHIANRFPAVRQLTPTTDSDNNVDQAVAGSLPSAPQARVSNGRQTIINAFHLILADGTEIPVTFFGSDDDRQFSLVKTVADMSLPAVALPATFPPLSRLSKVVFLNRLDAVMDREVMTIPSEVIAKLADGTPVFNQSNAYGALGSMIVQADGSMVGILLDRSRRPASNRRWNRTTHPTVPISGAVVQEMIDLSKQTLTLPPQVSF